MSKNIFKSMFKTRKRRALSILVISLAVLALIPLFIYLFRTTPNGNIFISKDTDLAPEKIMNMINKAQANNDALTDIEYSYSFLVKFEADDKEYRFGAENVIAFTGRGTADAMGYRTNTLTSVSAGTQQHSESESFYYSGGKIFTKRFDRNLKSEMAESDFIPYTEHSELSVNTDYLNEIFFEEAVVYNRFKGITEICFDKASDYLNEGIISFIGLDQSDYEYTIEDVLLTSIISKDGYLAEKHLTFKVEYNSKDDPDSVITYNGDFAYVLDKKSGVTVNTHNKADNYQSISNIKLLSSLTETGYQILSAQSGFDITYKKEITASDLSGNTNYYDGSLRIIAVKEGEALHYSSIDTEKRVKGEESHDTVGIFVNSGGYSERAYDYIKNETTSMVDNRAHDYTMNELLSTIMEAIAAERLYEGEIGSLTTKGETDTSVTYSIRLTPTANKYFAGYLLDMFTESEDSFDVSNFGFSSQKCDVEITVRKSDGCILNQVIDYAAELYGISGVSGTIAVQGRCEMTVNATGDNLTLLTVDDYTAEVESNKNK